MSREIGAVTPATMDQILAMLDWWKGARNRDKNRGQQNVGPIFYNASSHVVPPFGLVQVVDEQNTQQFGFVARCFRPLIKPHGTTQWLINGPKPVPANDYGMSQPGPHYRLIYDASAAAGAQPVIGDQVGFGSNSFHAKKNGGLCTVFSRVTSEGYLWVKPGIIRWAVGVTVSAINGGAIGQVRLGTGTITSRVFDAKHHGTGQIAAGAKVAIAWDDFEHEYVVSMEFC